LAAPYSCELGYLRRSDHHQVVFLSKHQLIRFSMVFTLYLSPFSTTSIAQKVDNYYQYFCFETCLLTCANWTVHLRLLPFHAMQHCVHLSGG
jgi:hypothetical protein